MLETSNDKCLIFSRGGSPLFEAVNQNHLELVKLLIKNGANVNARNEMDLDVFNNSILSRAKRINNIEIISLLEAAGAKE